MSICKYKNTILVSSGAAFEYYDFIVYALMANYLSEVFFKSAGLDSLIYYFSTFALGYLFRPLGGILFGLVSDQYGRKKSFLFIILLMSISTFIIGLLPTSSSYSVYLLVIARIMQGIAFGGEIPNAITFVQESNNRNSLHIGIVTSGSTFGNILALFASYLLTAFLSTDQIIAWGWRIPFLVGGVLALSCYFLRKNLHETAEYLATQDVSSNAFSPLKELTSKHKIEFAMALILSIFVSFLVVMVFYLPTYLPKFFGYDAKDVYFVLTISFIISIIITPFVGLLIDKFDKMKLIIATIATLVPSLYLIFELLSSSLLSLAFFVILYETLLSVLYVTYLSLMVDLFGARIRTTTIGFCYSIGYAVASFSPTLLTLLIKETGNKYMPLWFMIIVSAATLISLQILWNIFKANLSKWPK